MLNEPSSPALQRVIVALKKAGSTGSGENWQCPAHTDNSPSLSVSWKNGKVLLHCHAGCEFKEICSALHLTIKDLQGEPTRVAEYVYTSDNGSPLTRKVRFEPGWNGGKKSFCWEIFDEGVWRKAKTGEGNPHVLYHLNEVLKAETVHLHEGEKSVDRLRTLLDTNDKIASTCAPTTSWDPSFTDLLKKKQVIFWVDRDKQESPARKKSAQLAKSLLDADIDVQCVESRTTGEKDDAFDHFEAGFGLEEVQEIDLTVLLKSAETSTSGLKILSAADLIDMPEEDHQWVLEGRLLVGGTSLLGAYPKTGKSTVARSLAVAIAHGDDFMGFPTMQGPVVYLDLEGRPADLRTSLMALGMMDSDPIHSFVGVWQSEWFDEFQQQLKEIKPVLIIVDTMQRFLKLAKLNDYDETSNAFDNFIRPLALENQTHVMVLHHQNKSSKGKGGVESVLGSQAIAGGPDTVMLLAKDSDGKRVFTTEQRVGDSLQGDLGVVVEMDPVTHIVSTPGTKKELNKSEIETRVFDFLLTTGGEVARTKILENVEGSDSAILNALKELCASGKIIKSGKGVKNNGFVYSAVKPFPKHIKLVPHPNPLSNWPKFAKIVIENTSPETTDAKGSAA